MADLSYGNLPADFHDDAMMHILVANPRDIALDFGQPLVTGDIRPQARPAGLVERHTLAGLPRTLEGASDLTCLAVTIYHEARSESLAGQAAVASVILQRAAVPHRWGDHICEVTVPVQFSYLKRDKSFAAITEYDAWQTAVEIAQKAMAKGPDPKLENADHYHTESVNPSWSNAMPIVTRIGFHIFYADPASATPTG